LRFSSTPAAGWPDLDDILSIGVDIVWFQANFPKGKASAGECRGRGIAAFLHPDRNTLFPDDPV
jgi:hypothetical protein